jgi:hypothetical protein
LFIEDADDACRLAAFVDDRRVVEVHPNLLGPVVAVQRKFLILIGECAAGQTDLHHIIVELGDFRPAFADFRAEEPWMPAAGEDGIGIIVDHDAVFAPQHDDRYWGAQQDRCGSLQALGPAGSRSQRSRGPIICAHERAHRAAARQKIEPRRSVYRV